MVWEATELAPLASVTCRDTRWAPAVANDVRATPPDASPKFPSPLRSQASEAIDPSGSLDVDTSVTVSPVSGEPGTTTNDAVGGTLGGGGGGGGF